jgi:hypothetical protein
MFFAVRMVGWFFLFIGFMILVRDFFGGISTDHGFHPKTIADIWEMVSPGAPDDVEGSFMFHYGKTLWWPISVILQGWAFAELMLIGLVFDIAGRERADKTGKRQPKVAPKPGTKAAGSKS